MELLQDCKEQVVLPELGEDGALHAEITGPETMNDDQVKLEEHQTDHNKKS